MHIDMPTRDDRIHLRIEKSIKDDAEAVAHLRGLKLSSLVHTLLVEAVNKEKAERPELLADARRETRQLERKVRVQITPPANVADAGTSQPARLARQRKRAQKR